MNVMLTVSATIGNGYACAVSMEDVKVSCSMEPCRFSSCAECAINAFLSLEAF